MGRPEVQEITFSRVWVCEVMALFNFLCFVERWCFRFVFGADGSGRFLWRAAFADRLCLECPFSCRGALLASLHGLSKRPSRPDVASPKHTPATERPPAESPKGCRRHSDFHIAANGSYQGPRPPLPPDFSIGGLPGWTPKIGFVETFLNGLAGSQEPSYHFLAGSNFSSTGR